MTDDSGAPTDRRRDEHEPPREGSPSSDEGVDASGVVDPGSASYAAADGTVIRALEWAMAGS